MKHESAIISIKYNHRRALTNISEAQEQLPSSKDISEEYSNGSHEVSVESYVLKFSSFE